MAGTPPADGAAYYDDRRKRFTNLREIRQKTRVEVAAPVEAPYIFSMEELLQDNWLTATIASAVSALVTWFFHRRKQAAEAQASELDNVQTAIRIYRKATEDLQKELKASREVMSDLRKTNEELQKKVNEQTTYIKSLEVKIGSYQTEISKLRARLDRIDGGAGQ